MGATANSPDSAKAKSTQSNILRYVIYVVAVIGIMYHLLQTIYPIQSRIEHLDIHLGFSLVLVFLASLSKSKKRWPLLALLILVSIVTVTFVKIFYWDIESAYGMLTTADLIMATLLIIVVIEGCRQAMGLVIPIVAVTFLAYMFLGSYIPAGPLHISKVDPAEIISMLTFQFSGESGIYGNLLSTSAYLVLLFAVMGGLMQLSGAAGFFRNLGLVVGRKLQGGPAIMSVIGSALVGMVTGVATANILVIGTFTIPLMKRVGYSPSEAGAIEAAASNGGQIMPPVMGAAAFVMSTITGISYVTIMLAAILPALLYFLSLAMYVQLVAMKRNLKPVGTLGQKVNAREMLFSVPGFLVPLAVITFLFLKGFSPMFVAFWAVIASFAFALIEKLRKLSWTQLLDGMTAGMSSGATIGVTLATLGIVVKVMNVTGLGVKLPGIVETLSEGNLFIALLLVMAVCMVLGMGVPTTPAYILVAMVGAPVLIHLGLPLLTAHFFVLYYAVMALITPPVAPAAVVSSQIAGASYLSTGMEAVKTAFAGFLVPFIFVEHPIFLMQPGEGLFEGITALLAGLVMMLTALTVFLNYYLARTNIVERASLLICSLACFIYLVVLDSYLLLGVALVLFVLVTLQQLRTRRLSHAAITVQP